MQSLGPRFPSCARLRRSFVAGLALVATAMPALGQAPKGSVSLIRDAEIEQLLRDYAAPIFKAAGINARGTRIILINDRAFNAFVADGKSIFVNIGVLMDAATPNEVIGVLAHESGHLAGGHLARLRQEMQNAQILSIAGLLVGVGGVVAGARSGGSSIGNAGIGAMGAIAGPQELVRRAHELGYTALAITDECSLAGVVRAYQGLLDLREEASAEGLPEPQLKLIVGSEFAVDAGGSGRLPPPGGTFKLVLLACNRAGYGNLSEFITRVNRAAR